MNKFIMKVFSQIIKFFALEFEGFDVLDATEVLRRKNIIVNRLLLITNILITVFIVIYYESIGLPKSLSLLIPTVLINVLLTYFISSQKDDYEKQVMGMYLAILSVCYISLRLYTLYPVTFTYIFIYIALVIVALFQNRHAIILGDILIFSVASYIHINEVLKDNPLLINDTHDITVYTMFLILYIFVITSLVFFSEYMDNERKKELKKREELEEEFKGVLGNVFDTIDDFSQVTENNEITSEYVCALMARKLGLLMNFAEQKCDELFNFAIITGVNT
ncbi:MAG TPA: hypothetical protein VIK84_05435, partial [Haloplasmataceae bacterium]